MPLFSKTVAPETPFKKNDVVKATMDLAGVPAGTQGKIKVINGFSWVRYWVFFDNGVELGQLDADELVRPQHWDHFFEQKELRPRPQQMARPSPPTLAVMLPPQLIPTIRLLGFGRWCLRTCSSAVLQLALA